jgi:O-antigen/teichoic acid export membrane protein
MVIYFGMGLVALPEAARILRRSPRHLPLFCLLVSGGLAILALAWGAVLLVALPRGLGHLMLGNLWKPTYPLVWPATIFVLGACCGTGASTGLHALGSARRSLRVMVIASAVSVVLSVAGAAVGGVVWAMAGFAVGSWVGAVICWRQLRTALRESGGTPSGAASEPPSSALRHRRTADEPGRQLQPRSGR